MQEILVTIFSFFLFFFFSFFVVSFSIFHFLDSVDWLCEKLRLAIKRRENAAKSLWVVNIFWVWLVIILVVYSFPYLYFGFGNVRNYIKASVILMFCEGMVRRVLSCWRTRCWLLLLDLPWLAINHISLFYFTRKIQRIIIDISNFSK